MLEFIPGYFKNKEMSIGAAKKSLFAKIRVLNQHKTQQMCKKIF